MIRALIRWYRARQRAIDMKILWPACKAQAADIEIARTVFAAHAFTDRAWYCEYEDRLWDFIDTLE
jgi:hypothetical protein